jgi:hypothetical protein
MTQPEKWDQLGDLLRQMRDGLDRAVAEAQQRFERAVDDPLGPRAVEQLVAQALRRMGDGDSVREPALTNDLVFTSIANASAAGSWAGCRLEQLQDLYIEPSRAELAGLMTHITSASIDTRVLGKSRFRVCDRVGEPTASLVMDVWSGFRDVGSRSASDCCDAAVRWDTWLDLTSVNVPAFATCSTTSLDFAGYDDRAIDDLLRN